MRVTATVPLQDLAILHHFFEHLPNIRTRHFGFLRNLERCQSFRGRLENLQYRRSLARSAHVRRLPKHVPAARFPIEADGALHFLDVATPAVKRGAVRIAVQDQQGIRAAGQPERTGYLVDGIIVRGAFPDVMNDQDRGACFRRDGLKRLGGFIIRRVIIVVSAGSASERF